MATMSKNSRFKGVLFDLDGTLLDTISDITYALNSGLQVAQVEPITPAEGKGFVGRGLKNALKGALESRGKIVTPERLDELVGEVMRAYSLHPYRDSAPYGGIEELLNDLTKRGIVLGVLSNKADSLVQPIIKGVLGHHPFEFIRGAKEGWASKPDPEGIYAFSQQLRCDPSQLLLVGDSEVDYYTAEAAQIDVAIVTWGFRSRKSLEEAGCTNLYDTVDELRKEVFPWL
jgi:phosphoglycolate phosphatase